LVPSPEISGSYEPQFGSPEQTRLIHRAIANRHEIYRLLARWEDETVAEILGPDRSSA
jgi:hypothetical protein